MNIDEIARAEVMMCRVRVVSINQGMLPMERVVKFESTGGMQEVYVSARQVAEDAKTMNASKIAEEDNAVLIELPRETTSGAWRVWVDSDLVVG